MTKISIVAWITLLIGSALWVYGYFVVGHSPIIDWHANTPWWIADFLPNVESEVGMLLCTASMVPMYWPISKNKSRQ